jgi:hypothetical protein
MLSHNNVYNFPRQRTHYATVGTWRLMKSKIKINDTAYMLSVSTDVELGDIVFIMGNDDVMHRTRVIEAFELEQPITSEPKDSPLYWMLCTVKLADPKGLTDQCDIRNI